MQQKITAILLMAGLGRRFESEVPKQFHRICGKKIYLHTVDRFLQVAAFEEILLVCHPQWIAEVEKDIASYPKDRLRIVCGAATRQESSYLGLMACHPSTSAVVIHDGVRPFVSEKILQNHVQALASHEAVDTCIPSTDTVVYAKNGVDIDAIPKRAEYFRGQTPQSFYYDLIVKAHQNALTKNIANASDDCQLVLHLGKKVHIISGDERNIKITTELDLYLAQQLLRLSTDFEEKEKNFSSLYGKTIVVTGGTGGIGKAIIQQLEKYGAKPISISQSSVPYSCNLTDPKKVEAIFEEIFQNHGPIDALINSVGILKAGEFQNISLEDMEKMLSINLNSVLYTCKYAQIKSGGHIINISSSSYNKGRKGLAIYSCTKAAVVNFTQGLSEELPHLSINAIIPQRTATKLRKDNFPQEPIESLLTPENVAQTVIEVLCQNKITGLTIEVRKKDECSFQMRQEKSQAS